MLVNVFAEAEEDGRLSSDTVISLAFFMLFIEDIYSNKKVTKITTPEKLISLRDNGHLFLQIIPKYWNNGKCSSLLSNFKLDNSTDDSSLTSFEIIINKYLAQWSAEDKQCFDIFKQLSKSDESIVFDKLTDIEQNIVIQIAQATQYSKNLTLKASGKEEYEKTKKVAQHYLITRIYELMYHHMVNA